MDYTEFGFIRTAALAPVVSLADPAANARAHIEAIGSLEAEAVSLALFPAECAFLFYGFESTIDQTRFIAHFEGLRRWSGLRPCSPDGLPYIGPAGDNVFIASGHSMMGLSLAPVTGEIMAGLLCGKQPDIDIAALVPDRFS